MLAEDLDGFVAAVLESPWGDEYGVAPESELAKFPDEHAALRLRESLLRRRIQQLASSEPHVQMVAPLAGRFVIFVERMNRQMTSELGTSSRGDLFVSSKHNLAFGDYEPLDDVDALVELYETTDEVTVRIAVFYRSKYVADLMLQCDTK